MIRRILVPLDGSEYARAATRCALEIACRHNSQLAGIAVIDVPGISREVSPMGIGASYYAKLARERMQESADAQVHEILTEFNRACAQACVTSIDIEAYGVPYEAILEESKYYDLVVMGARSFFEHGSDEDDGGKTMHKSLKNGIRPHLVVPRVYEPVDSVLILFDGSIQSAKAMQMYALLAPWPKATHRVLTISSDQEQGEVLLSHATAYLASYGIRCRRKILRGNPKDVVSAYADEIGAKLLVLGAYGQNRIAQFFFGSVTKAMIEKAARTLFLYH